MVATPTVTPNRGTASSWPPKLGKVARLSRRVDSGSATTRVRAPVSVPGGLNAT